MSNLTIKRRSIRRAVKAYRTWLLDSQRFQRKSSNTQAKWLALFNDIEKAMTSHSPALMWEAVVDHLHCMRCELDSSPSLFQNLYELVDTYRSEHDVMGTGPRDLLIEALQSPLNQSVSPNIVISQLYEALSSNELHCDTDIDNGEDYFYKHSLDVSKTSIALHPEVVEYFGFKCKYLRVDGIPLFFTGRQNREIAAYFKHNWEAVGY